MSESAVIDDTRVSSPQQYMMKRRTLLKTLLTAGTVATAGGSLLTACANDNEQSVTEVVLFANNWPFKTAPTADDKKSVTYKAQVESLQNWMRKNPKVKLRNVAVTIENAKTLNSALAARTAPDWYSLYSDVATTRMASSLNLAADTTELVKKYNVESLLADYTLPRWKALWGTEQKYSGLPADMINPGFGIFYRRDIFQKAGITEPRLGWSWQNWRDILKKLKAYTGKVAMQVPPWMIGWILNSAQLEFLRTVPAPSEGWHYRYKYTPWLDRWTENIEIYRGALLDDGTIEQGDGYDEWTAADNVAQGLIPMASSLSTFLTFNPSFMMMSRRLGRPLDELVGFVPYPSGSNGAIMPDFAAFGPVGLNPYRNTAIWDKATSLWLYMFYGQGYIDQRAMRYALTKDPKMAYDYITPGNRYQKNPDVPVTVSDAWGVRFVQSWMDGLSVPTVPEAGSYFPPETKTPPDSSEDIYHATQKELTTTRGDIATILKKSEDAYNSQASTRSSSISREVFTASAKVYYSALDKFWKENSPQFYQGDWNKFYHELVLPVLK